MVSKFDIYKSLNMRLKRAGFTRDGLNKKFPNNGHICTYLCDLFLKMDGIVRRQDLVDYGIIHATDHTTNAFLEALVKTRFISWDMEENTVRGCKHYQVFAHVRLADLIEREKVGERVTKVEFQKLKSRTEGLENCIRKIIEKFDPPCTDEKFTGYTKNSTV